MRSKSCGLIRSIPTLGKILLRSPPSLRRIRVLSNPMSKVTASQNQNQKQEQEHYVFEYPQDTSLLPTLGVTCWLGINGLLVYIISFLLFPFSYTPSLTSLLPFDPTTLKTSILITALTLSLLPLPKDASQHKLGYKFGDLLMRCAASYFSLKITCENPQSLSTIAQTSTSGVIFAMEPHDILPFPLFAFNDGLSCIPHVKNAYGLMTSAIFNIPLLRHIYTYTRGHPVDKKTFQSHLKSNHNVVFVPGGVNEVFEINPDKPDEIILYLNKRKGFVKLALEQGTPIVPCFAFGLSGTYDFVLPKFVYKHKFVIKLSKLLGFLPIYFSGRWGVPFGIPHPNQINLVIGTPISTLAEKGKVDQETIDKVHSKFLAELTALFQRHKKSTGNEHKTIVII